MLPNNTEYSNFVPDQLLTSEDLNSLFRYLDEQGRILGKGLTNSRSDYDVACAVSKGEAFADAQFTLCAQALQEVGLEQAHHDRDRDDYESHEQGHGDDCGEPTKRAVPMRAVEPQRLKHAPGAMI